LLLRGKHATPLAGVAQERDLERLEPVLQFQLAEGELHALPGLARRRTHHRHGVLAAGAWPDLQFEIKIVHLTTRFADLLRRCRQRFGHPSQPDPTKPPRRQAALQRLKGCFLASSQGALAGSSPEGNAMGRQLSDGVANPVET
jgi:hypothetical protein